MKDGHKKVCKTCVALYSQKYLDKNFKKQREYYQNNSERIKERTKKYHKSEAGLKASKNAEQVSKEIENILKENGMIIAAHPYDNSMLVESIKYGDESYLWEGVVNFR